METKVLPALMFVLLAGCATAYDPGHPYEQAWRVGRVEDLGSVSAAFPITGFDCRSHVTRAPDSGGVRYAYVRFEFSSGTKYLNSVPKQRHVIVEVPDDMDVHEGEGVYVNIRDCNQRLARR